MRARKQAPASVVAVALTTMVAFGMCHHAPMRLEASVARADTVPHPDVFNHGADGAHHTGCWEGAGALPAALQSHINYLNGKGYNMQITVEAPCTGITDARWSDTLPVDSGLAGQTLCRNVGGDFGATVTTLDDECDSWTVRMAPGGTCGNKQMLWCHETGHSMGLGHEAGCMQAPCNASTTYSAHHLGHLQSY